MITTQVYSLGLNMDGCPLSPDEASKEHSSCHFKCITFHWAPFIKCSLCNKSKSHVTFMQF